MEGKIKVRKIERQMYIKGYTVASLAEKTGLSKLTIGEVLSCKRRPSPTTSELIASALDMEVTDFRAAIYDAKQSA